MNEYNFRNANKREEESYTTYMVEELGYSREQAEDIVDDAHVGILEGYCSSAHGYRGTIMIVLHQNVTMYEVYIWGERGDLDPISQDSGFHA